MPVHRVLEIQRKYGDLHDVIPKLVNEVGQVGAGRLLGISPATVNGWLKVNGYILKRQYIRTSREGIVK